MSRVQESKFLIHVRVVRALIRREIVTRFGRTAGGYLWAIGEPAAFVLILTLIFEQLAHRPPLGSSFFLFFATGYIGFQFYRGTEEQVTRAVAVNTALMNFPRVTPFDSVVARALLQLTTTSATSIIVFTVILVGIGRLPDLHLEYLFGAIAASTLLAIGIGGFNAIAIVLYPVWDRITSVVNRPLFIISGVFFLPESLPSYVQNLLWYNPVAHLVCLFRKAFYPEYESTFLSYEYIFVWIIVSLAMGMYVLNAYRFKVIEQ